MSKKPPPADDRDRPTLVTLADVAPESIAWLWPGRIPVGKLTLLAGDPGLGKSMLTLDIAARVSRGSAWPDHPNEPQTAGGVILLSAEDHPADTIRPRLDAAGADVSRVHALTSPIDLSRDVEHLAASIDAVPGVRLIVVDPLSAFMGRTDTHRDGEVRGVLAQLAGLASAKGVTILAVSHLRKGDGAAVYRTMGSLAFVAAARAAWAVCRDPTDPKRRLLLAIKNNLGGDRANGLAFAIRPDKKTGAPMIVWQRGRIDITADEAMARETSPPGPKPAKLDAAVAWLRNALENGPRPATELEAESAGAGVSPTTLQRAKAKLAVASFRDSVRDPWQWKLPEQKARQNHRLKQPDDLGNLGNVRTTHLDGLDRQDSQVGNHLTNGHAGGTLR
jgi:hypothetical protein